MHTYIQHTSHTSHEGRARARLFSFVFITYDYVGRRFLMHNSALQVFKRFYEPKLLDAATKVKICCSDSLFVRYKTQIAMLNNKKLIESREDTLAQQETSSLSWLRTVAPIFPVNGSKITIIHKPQMFYTTLLEKCKRAKKRITFASLYLGTGPLETELVNVIEKAMNTSEGNLQVRILLDYMRGSRGKQNSRKMLEPLLKGKYGDRCKVFLYHTPKLRGVMKATIPDRFNELIGLQHMKLYIIDDDLIISGANLSNDYFTNRQDRYFVIEDCAELCDFYNKLIERVMEFSFLLQSDGNTDLNSAVNCIHPLKGSRKTFIQEVASRIQMLFRDEMEKRASLDKEDADTWIFPMVQMGQLDVYHDSAITLKLIQTAPIGATLRLATGYFNLTFDYSQALLRDCQATCHLLTAHPTANGFFNAKGIAGGIPAAYTKIEESFYDLCEKMDQHNRITLWEFIKPGWTYHAKGLWYTLPDQRKPSLTLIGSSNFGYRSVNRDLETQIAVVTKNNKLQDALHEEQAQLFSCAKPATRKTFLQQDRVPPAWVCAVVLFFRYYF